MSTSDPRPSSQPFTELAPADVTRVTGGQFDWSSLAQSLMQNVSGQLGGSGSPAGGMLGMVAGMLGKAGGGTPGRGTPGGGMTGGAMGGAG